jgi:hypothetical protein
MYRFIYGNVSNETVGKVNSHAKLTYLIAPFFPVDRNGEVRDMPTERRKSPQMLVYWIPGPKHIYFAERQGEILRPDRVSVISTALFGLRFHVHYKGR